MNSTCWFSHCLSLYHPTHSHFCKMKWKVSSCPHVTLMGFTACNLIFAFGNVIHPPVIYSNIFGRVEPVFMREVGIRYSDLRWQRRLWCHELLPRKITENSAGRECQPANLGVATLVVGVKVRRETDWEEWRQERANESTSYQKLREKLIYITSGLSDHWNESRNSEKLNLSYLLLKLNGKWEVLFGLQN